MVDKDGIAEETNHELGLREEIKADYSRAAAKDPMAGSFRAVESHAHNLKNVRGLLEQYPEEYAKRMRESAIRPHLEEGRRLDSGWFQMTFAVQILKGLFDANKVEYVKEFLGEDKLGIPEAFTELPEMQREMKALSDRPWASEEVGKYLETVFNVKRTEEESNKPIKRFKADTRPFS